MTDTAPSTQQKVDILDPPRIDTRNLRNLDDTIVALRRIVDYLNELYRGLLDQFLAINSAYGTDEDFDPGALLNPATATLSEVAQAVNQATLSISENKARIDEAAGVAKLDLTAAATYNQAQIQSIIDKIDEIVDALEEPS